MNNEYYHHEHKIKRIRNIIKRYEEGDGTIGSLVTAWEHIKEQVKE